MALSGGPAQARFPSSTGRRLTSSRDAGTLALRSRLVGELADVDESGTVPQEVNAAFGRVREEATKSCAYFHTWWSLRNLAYPDFLPTMRDHEHVDFFRTCQVACFAMTFVSLGKLLDRDDRSLGLGRLRRILCQHGYDDVAASMKVALSGHVNLVKRVVAIRNRTISHNDLDKTRDGIFKEHGTTPDEIRALVEAIRTSLNQAGHELGWTAEISAGERHERATMACLRRLHVGMGYEP